MKSKRGRDGTPAANRVDRDAPMFKQLLEDLQADTAQRKKATAEREVHRAPDEPIGRCAYCGRELCYDRSYHWMYDEDGQRVRKCKNLRACASKRKKNGQEESYRRAMALFNRTGQEAWLDFESGTKNGRDE